MSTQHRSTIGGAALALALSMAGGAFAQAPGQDSDDHAAHHPGGEQTAQASPPSAPAAPAAPAVGRPGGMMMQGGPAQTMPMMLGRAGGQAGPMGAGMPGMEGMHRGGMAPFHRIEGSLAFLRAELRITDAQMPQWNAFAEAVRAQAQRLRETFARAMQGADQPATAPQLLERRIALRSAELDAMRAVSMALAPLYAALNDEQKRTADELMGEHLRGMRMGMP
ncbi:Spy/CpxP family protein refolding chaperone [Roseomonas sp. JC162]|uniref:Spy/CpxP family protein refolding chaperone n=1 Tax=Neoroseomonas marina TaxID=1232220 RepID=A0A848E659_9PROT|nr:Spy/CpxP family protein refolding chaperone [Neoroseomonas marina]NMJ39904.1 Spy/CpxP family protein refolding chaperone [Neoroseomonas marina]